MRGKERGWEWGRHKWERKTQMDERRNKTFIFKQMVTTVEGVLPAQCCDLHTLAYLMVFVTLHLQEQTVIEY